MTLSMSLDIADRDIIKMIEEYLANRHLDISLMCLERETGIINGRSVVRARHFMLPTFILFWNLEYFLPFQ